MIYKNINYIIILVINFATILSIFNSCARSNLKFDKIYNLKISEISINKLPQQVKNIVFLDSFLQEL